MDVQQPRKIRNEHFKTLCDVIQEVIGEYLPSGSEVLSTMIEASVDDHDDEKVRLYNEREMNLETIKPDDLTQYLCKILKLKEKDVKHFEQLPAADAICIDAHNEWYVFEFKNSDIGRIGTNRKNKPQADSNNNKNSTINSIRKKMLNTIWFVFYLYSKTERDVMEHFNGDMVEFARKHITYIIVGNEKNNTRYTRIIREKLSAKQHFTPPGFEQYIDYYFKDVYMLTEKELRSFIRDFKS